MRAKKPAHLAYVRQLPCIICNNNIETEACHIRFADPSVGKPITGIGIKPDDWWVVPMCGAHHHEQHHIGNEKFFWKLWSIDPIRTAMALYLASGNVEKGEQIVRASAQPVFRN